MMNMMKMNTHRLLPAALIFLGLTFSCSSTEALLTKPENTEAESILIPELTLKFENIEAENPETLYLDFNLDVYNTRTHDAYLLFQNPSLLINGNLADESLFSIGIPENALLTQQERKHFPLRLTFHASAYEKIYQHDFDEYELSLTIPLCFLFHDTVINTNGNAAAVFPRVRKPNFTITAIKIMQADLINTRLRVSLALDNPNHFPVELTSFHYELYGDGRFWAAGEEKNILRIPAKETAGIDLFLTMNFTNMRRNILDQIIAMTEVRYQFKGKAEINTGTEHIPRFVTQFEQTGHSEVTR